MVFSLAYDTWLSLDTTEMSCPKCGENLMDYLCLNSDTNTVTCETCGHKYSLD